MDAIEYADIALRAVFVLLGLLAIVATVVFWWIYREQNRQEREASRKKLRNARDFYVKHIHPDSRP